MRSFLASRQMNQIMTIIAKSVISVSKPICHNSCLRAAIALLMAFCIESRSLWCTSLSCLAERKASFVLTIFKSSISLLILSLWSCVATFSFLSIWSRMLATFSATFTGVVIESMMALLLSCLMLSVSACSFLKASASRRKNPRRVFITSTVVFFASWVCGALE